MSNENNAIHGFDVNLICDFFLNTERQGPGNPEVTIKALSFIDNLTDESLIADLGCGTGGQTMTLARHAPGRITGLDFFPGFIDRFNADARRLHLADRVKGVVGSMDALPFRAGELDLIWSEGAIYNIGFEKGLTQWRRFLKPDGFIAVTECSWLSSARPDEMGFFRDNFPEIDDISGKIRCMERAGYRPVAHFILPDSCWTENYYAPAAARAREFLATYDDAPLARHFVERLEEEIEQYRRYGRRYGYVFYIGQRTD